MWYQLQRATLTPCQKRLLPWTLPSELRLCGKSVVILEVLLRSYHTIPGIQIQRHSPFNPSSAAQVQRNGFREMAFRDMTAKGDPEGCLERFRVAEAASENDEVPN